MWKGQTIGGNTVPRFTTPKAKLVFSSATPSIWCWAGRLDLDMALDDLEQARRGDVILLDGSCHNPSGVDPSKSDWAAIAPLSDRKGLIPLVDVAYQSLGRWSA